MRFLTILSVVLLGFGGIAQASKRGPPIVLESNVANELNRLLNSSELVQKSVVSQDEKLIQHSLRQMIVNIDRARVVSGIVNGNSRHHLLKILEAARYHLEYVKVSQGEQRRESFKEALAQISNLPRIYALDSKYRIFFCSKDRSSWVQSTKSPQNPIHPQTLGGCGKLAD